jgi:hypothetical protein
MLEWHPLTPERWVDFVSLFGKNGACAGCWCMWWRQTRSESEQRHGAANRRARSSCPRSCLRRQDRGVRASLEQPRDYEKIPPLTAAAAAP